MKTAKEFAESYFDLSSNNYGSLQDLEEYFEKFGELKSQEIHSITRKEFRRQRFQWGFLCFFLLIFCIGIVTTSNQKQVPVYHPLNYQSIVDDVVDSTKSRLINSLKYFPTTIDKKELIRTIKQLSIKFKIE